MGNGGKTLWENLPHPVDVNHHPFDRYTLNQIHIFAKNFLNDDCEILFPNDAYTLPLQKIGRFLNLCSQSPIGPDISNEFGLWFAFRGVFLTRENVWTAKYQTPPSLCESCLERPCLLTSDRALARLNCPIKNEHQYSKEQIAYHQNVLDTFHF